MTTFEDVIDELRTQLDTKEFDINVLTNAYARHLEEIAELKAELEDAVEIMKQCIDENEEDFDWRVMRKFIKAHSIENEYGMGTT